MEGGMSEPCQSLFARGTREIESGDKQLVGLLTSRRQYLSVRPDHGAMAVTERFLSGIFFCRVGKHDVHVIAQRSRYVPIASQLWLPFVGIIVRTLKQYLGAGEDREFLDTANPTVCANCRGARSAIDFK